MAGRDLPTGTLTFLFTDLEGSTRLLHEFPDEYASLLETHRHLIRDAVTSCGGVEFGTGGDALFVVFDSAPAAVECVANAQRALQSYAWPIPAVPKVRMALHTGEARIVDDDYVGLALHVVARLCSAGHGEQVLLSSTTRELASQAEVRDLGVHRLRDVAEPMQVFQLCGQGMVRDFPPLRTLDARPNNLPVPSDRLIGRDLETIEIVAALHEHRLVTLTGSGGSGKTRLALAVGASLVGDFADGVWLIELAAATTPDQVVAFIAQALRASERQGVDLSATVVEHLAAKEMLIVIDNCEHLVDAVAAVVDELISRCPRVRVLATSRELIGVHGEQAIAVAPLAVGDPEHLGDAMLLFIERASEMNPDFSAAGEDLAAIADMCQRLDGLPLAIELAAARTRTVSVAQLTARLHDRFRLLTGGTRTALGRQRTLEAVVAWSYDLLTSAEQRLFRYLCVFPDSFPLDAAETVAATDEADVLETLGHLVDKSLVLALPGTAYRYRMLETIRQYGRDRLLEHDEPDDAHTRLLAWIMTLIVQLEQDMRTPRQDAALRAVLPERSNARYALEWAIEHDDLGDALRITSTVPLMVTSQRRTLLEQLLDQTPDLTQARRAQVLITLGNLAMEQGRFEETAHFTQEAADIFARLGDERHHAWARYFQVFGLWGKPEAEEDARHLAHEMVNSFRHLNDNFGLAYALWVASQFAHEPEEAQNDARESEDLFRQLNARFGLAHALEGRALVALKNDTTAGTESVLAEALTILADAENLGCTAHCLEAIAAVLALNDRLEDAAVLLGAAQNLREEVGQEHRAWEREGQRRTQHAFDQSQHRENLDRAQAHGRTLTFLEAVERAHSLLNPHGSAHPDSTPSGAQSSHRRPALYGDP